MKTSWAIADFLYLGETNIFHDNLDTFLALAGELKLKGLTGNGKDKENVPKVAANSTMQGNEEKKRGDQTFPYVKEDPVAHQFETRVVAADKTVIEEPERLDEQINTMIDPTDKMVNQRRISRCNICGYEGPRSFAENLPGPEMHKKLSHNL